MRSDILTERIQQLLKEAESLDMRVGIAWVHRMLGGENVVSREMVATIFKTLEEAQKPHDTKEKRADE